ncbi:S9 family peptidase [Glaciecola sp. MH2013]|nr:S9 family peptidase [Glaciecola sp. MH2013]
MVVPARALLFTLFFYSVAAYSQQSDGESASHSTEQQSAGTTSKIQLPASAFASLPEYESVSLSPSGRKVAFVRNISEPEHLALLSTFDLDTGKRFLLVKSDNDEVKLNWFRWANDETLVISAKFGSRERGTRYYQTRLMAMRYDDQGVKPKVLIKPRRASFGSSAGGNHMSQFQDNVIDYLPDDPGHIMVAVDFDVPNMPSVYKIALKNGKKSRIEKGKRQIRSWITDQQSRLRIGVAYDYDDGDVSIYERKDNDAKFRTLFKYNSLKDDGPTILGFDLDPNVLYLRKYKGDKLALYSMDLTSLEQTLVFADDNYDVDGRLIYSSKTREVIGVGHAHAQWGIHYFKNGRESFHKGLDAALPETSNFFQSFSEDENRYILYAESDNVPGIFLLGDRKNQSLQGIFETYPQLNEITIANNKKVSYQTRDGLEIEGYLTLPTSGEAPFPTVIHPHGGPGARDYSGFDFWTAFMSHRGYAVFRPNFRGSSGYGREFSEAQMRRWGLEMQDDLTDATKWLIAQGTADPSKICIVGASYGGYAATMATVKTPDLFKCAVSFAGVSHLPKLAYRQKQFLGGDLVVENQIGDDKDDMRARSPYYNVEKVKVPTLLVHGKEDRVVHVEQSRLYADELEDHNKAVTYIEFENGDHHLTLGENRKRFFEEMDTFLADHLK